MMRIFIAGGAGFGGRGLTRAAKERGHKVTVLDIVPPLHSEIHSVVDCYLWKGLADVTSRDLEGTDVVVNMAAQADVPMGFTSPRWTVQQNTEGSVALLEAVREQPVYLCIHASTGNYYGRPSYIPIDENHPPVPHNVYSASKIAQEMLFWAYWRMYGIPVTVMSNGVVIGPGMRREIFIFKWLKNIIEGRPILVEGGNQTRDITYVSDTVDAWVKLIEAHREDTVGQKFQVSFGEEHTVAEIASWCFQACGIDLTIDLSAWELKRQSPEFRLQSGQLAVEVGPYRPGEEGMRECFDVSKSQRILGYKARVSPKEAILKTAEWVKTIIRENGEKEQASMSSLLRY